jgi:hypothetical protein
MLLPNAVALARSRFKPNVDAWITSLIDADVKKGRTQDDFTTPAMAESVRKIVTILNAKGYDVYQGGGNVFQVMYVANGPTIVHTRPLAQRVVRPIFM